MRTIMGVHLQARTVRGEPTLIEVPAEPTNVDGEWVVNDLSRHTGLVPGDRVRVNEAGDIIQLVGISNLGLVVLLTDVPLERRQAEGTIPAATSLDVEATTLKILEDIAPLVRYTDHVAGMIYAVPINAEAVLKMDEHPLVADRCDVVRYPNGMVYERPLALADRGKLEPITLDWIRRYASAEMPDEPPEDEAWERQREFGNKPPREWLE